MSAVPEPRFNDCRETQALAVLTERFHALEELKEQARMAWSWRQQAQSEIGTFLIGERQEREAAGTLSQGDALELSNRRVKFACQAYKLWSLQKPLSEAVKAMLTALNDASRQELTSQSPCYYITLFNLGAGLELLLEAAEYLKDDIDILPDRKAQAAVEERSDSGRILYRILDTVIPELVASQDSKGNGRFSIKPLFRQVLRCLNYVVGNLHNCNPYSSPKMLALSSRSRQFLFDGDMKHKLVAVCEYLQQHGWQATTVDDNRQIFLTLVSKQD